MSDPPPASNNSTSTNNNPTVLTTPSTSTSLSTTTPTTAALTNPLDDFFTSYKTELARSSTFEPVDPKLRPLALGLTPRPWETKPCSKCGKEVKWDAEEREERWRVLKGVVCLGCWEDEKKG
ncbi:hypothetical protein BJ508DRAFT_366249 [Ascobolus immersus RN42]|uniref:Uncharacterized protein n=1 Tax=Ascobolus immersus RN42 TaxID=1160509 RepID=A0A3N4HKS2_ASCIM|nr:hypothetical protein BJ508DRAFT_366249 [Ascobolus immersus RN42]